ncbi:MAG: hypothetical protein DI578_19430 [Ectopseudomonas oleovorans]|nr:MAG: hypothetical protein DI578_19430 [Pseudomonas oleovorans]
MSNFDLTIAIPTYNSIAKMEETIASLEKVSGFVDCEVIFVDDCSKDDTFARLSEVCEDYEDWKVFKLEKNSGSAAALGLALAAAGKGLTRSQSASSDRSSRLS